MHCLAFSNLISACLSQIEYSENILPVNMIGAIFKAGVNDVNVLKKNPLFCRQEGGGYQVDNDTTM